MGSKIGHMSQIIVCVIYQYPCKVLLSYLPGRRDEGSVEVEHVAVVPQAVNDHGQVLLQSVVVVVHHVANGNMNYQVGSKLDSTLIRM